MVEPEPVAPEGWKYVLVPENSTILVVEATAEGEVTKAADLAAAVTGKG
jgi:hypothetical protein